MLRALARSVSPEDEARAMMRGLSKEAKAKEIPIEEPMFTAPSAWIREAPGHGNENCDRAGRVNRALAITLGRRPSQAERGILTRLHEQSLGHFRSHPDEARQMAGTLSKPPGAGDDELAAWSVVGRTLMNLDEFITRE